MRQFPFSLVATPSVGNERRYLFISREALLSFAKKMLRDRFTGSRIPEIWDNGVWTVDMEALKQLNAPLATAPVFLQVARLFQMYAEKKELSTEQKQELFDAVFQAFDVAGIPWDAFDYYKPQNNIERDLPKSPYTGINLIPGAQKS